MLRRSFDRVQPVLAPVLRVLAPPVIGLMSAAALASDKALVVYFISTVLVMVLIIFFSLGSVIQTKDNTMIHFPTVFKADGTTFTDEPTTVFEYDKHLIMYYASELPVFAAAAAWFYLWTHLRFTMLIYAFYVTYRLTREPVFRVHFWKESPETNHRLRRPFGLAPIFDPQTTPLTVVAGLEAFENMLNATPADKLIVIDASATWCGPCRVLAPIFEDMAREFTQCKFLTIDVDISADVTEKLAITSIPTVLFYKGGEQLETIRAPSTEQLRSAIETHM